MSGLALVGDIVTRDAWTTRRPKRAVSRTIDPSAGVIGHYGGGERPLWPYSVARAETILRGWQAYHQDHHDWADIAYNLAVDLFGRIYILRGPGHRSAANGTNPVNATAYAICLVMNAGDPLTDAGKLGFLAARDLLRTQDPRTGPRIRGHRDVRQTACPGDPVQQWIAAGCPRPVNTGPAPTPAPKPPTQPRRRRMLYEHNDRIWLKLDGGPPAHIATPADFYAIAAIIPVVKGKLSAATHRNLGGR